MEFNNTMVHRISDVDVLPTVFIHQVKLGVGVDDTFKFEDWDLIKMNLLTLKYSRYGIMLRNWGEFQRIRIS